MGVYKKVCIKVRNQELIVQVMLFRNVKENKKTKGLKSVTAG